jgi:predicted porin
MNKNVIALAVAAAMAAPLAAQAEVTVSGTLQAEIISLDGDNVQKGLYVADAQEGGKVGSGNAGALNFSASEDLGDGLKAIAKYGVNVDVDGKAPAQRDAYVGLSGGFGTVMAGTLTTPYASSTKTWDPFLATAAQARGNYGMSALHNGYAKNAIAYANKFGMAKVVAAVVIDDGASTAVPAVNETNGKNALSFSVNMPVGPVEIALAYVDASEFSDIKNLGISSASSAAPATLTATKVGVKYTAGAIGVAAQFETIDSDAANTTDTAYVTGTYTMGANTFAVSYGQEDNGTTTPTYVAVGMVHGFSKNVRAHVGYIGMDHDDNTTDSGIAAGLRVAF